MSFLHALALSLSSTISLLAQDAARPNIVVILADDMGYTDIGCYGSEIRTPNIDRLAANGLRFSQFYNTSRCCPTRASLLTGLYPHQAGIGLMTGDRGYDAYRGDLNERCMTIAEALRPAGYRGYMAGKWHVTRHVAPNGNKDNWPLQRGFDRFYGTITGAGSFFDPATLCRGNTYVTPENDPEYQPERFYYTDAISDNAVRFVREHLAGDEAPPFLLYVAYTTAHWPMHALEADIARYDGTYDDGYEPIRVARLRRARELGVLDGSWEMSSAVQAWDRTEHQDWEIRSMEVYAAMIDRMDQGIGRIVGELTRQGVLEDTLILYLQDNGGCAEGYGRRSNADELANAEYQPLGPDGLQKKIWPPMQTRDGRAVRTGPETMPGGEDTFIAYGAGWANVSNTPFRGFKHDAYEGGISTPLVVHWPRGLPESHRNAVIDDPSHLIDVMPTLLAAAGVAYPEQSAGRPVQPLEGVSLLPALAGEPLRRASPLGFEHHGNQALRSGGWKIVSQYRREPPRQWELYDMAADRTELHDLAAEQPERLQQLVAQWDEWAARVGVQPWPFENGPAWVPLFDGETLDGWVQHNGTAEYRVEDGAIVGRTQEGSPNSFLCTERDYADFELKFEVKVDSRLNSGVQIRSRTQNGDNGRVNGPQVEIEASGSDGAAAGYLYGEAAGGWMTPDSERTPHQHFVDDAWNAYRVLAVGPNIKVWINGVLISNLTHEARYESHPRGFIGLQVHGIARGAGPYEVRWRNLAIREARR